MKQVLLCITVSGLVEANQADSRLKHVAYLATIVNLSTLQQSVKLHSWTDPREVFYWIHSKIKANNNYANWVATPVQGYAKFLYENYCVGQGLFSGISALSILFVQPSQILKWPLSLISLQHIDCTMWRTVQKPPLCNKSSYMYCKRCRNT